MKIITITLCLAILIATTAALPHGQDVKKSVKRYHGKKIYPYRQPEIRPDLCRSGQLYYHTDKDGEGVCDCGPSYIYYPDDNNCYLSHSQGPCEYDEILRFDLLSNSPRCVKNPCKINELSFKGRCYKMGEYDGACKHGFHLAISMNTLNLICKKIPQTYVARHLFPQCPRGCERDYRRRCIPEPSDD